jgi:hypothetical protein
MGVPLLDVQKSLGHADSKTTLAYDQSKNHLHKHATHTVTANIIGAIEGF